MRDRILMLVADRKGMSVAENIALIRDSMGATKAKLIAVTKSAGIDQIAQAFDCGVTEYGENRVQDALTKQEQMPPHMADKVHWHFIGHLQTNKVKKVVGRFSLIHSVDSMHLAQEISKEAQRQSLRQPILLQVKVVEDPGKGGFTPEELKENFQQLLDLPNLDIKGLMTITPLTADQSIRHRCFQGLRDLQSELQNISGVQLSELSMGMSDDWQEAIEYGATMVRLGRAIFGNRAA